MRGKALQQQQQQRGRNALAVVVCCALVLGLCAAGSPLGPNGAYFALDSGTMAVGPGAGLTAVFDSDELVAGTRVLASAPNRRELANEQRDWLEAGTVPRIPELSGSAMVRDALLDLHVLSGPYGVPVAGWASAWRYVWPRDSALVATALAETGHSEDAEQVLTFLQRVQPEKGSFEARYRPDGTAVLDGRRPQVDSLGWVLWALAGVTDTLPVQDRRAFVERYRPLLDRSVRAALALVDNPRALPPASPDYWETEERELTLSTAALLHAGLVAARPLYELVGQSRTSAQLATASTRTAQAIARSFAPDGYPRTLGGSAGSVDLGVSYLLPPFTSAADAEVLEVWRRSAERMARPAGGLAPGGSWRADGVSWATATSSNALTAAAVGDRGTAVARLRWLDAHRTGPGSLPEKVLQDGQPASVAPLAWAAAAVIIAVAELQDRAG